MNIQREGAKFSRNLFFKILFLYILRLIIFNDMTAVKEA